MTSKFISIIDVLELGMRSVDECAPGVRDVQSALSNYPNLPPHYTGLKNINKWVEIFNAKKATDSLSDDEIRELKYELQQALQNFNDIVLSSK